MFCPPLDSALVAAIVSDENDVNECFNILSSLAEEANSFLDAERENFGESEFSENCSSNYKSSTSERDSGENGNGSITSAEYQTDNPYIVDDFDYESIFLTGDEIPLDEKIERLNFLQNEVEQSSPESLKEFLKACFPEFSENRIDVLLLENDNNAETVSDIILNEICLAEQTNCVYYDSFPLTPPISERDDDFSVSDSRSKHRKKKRHRKSKKQGIVIFQNNALRPNSMTSSNPSSPQMPSSSSPQMSFSPSSQDLFLSDGAILNLETRQYQDTQKKSNIPVNSRNYVKSTSVTTFRASKSLPTRECMKKRNEAFKKAANAFQKSKGSRNGEGGIAFHYSTEGRNFDAEMKKWNLRAARSIVRRQSKKNGDANLLDLHGLRVDEALAVVKEKLDEWYPIRGQAPSRPLKIVTGLGNHSPNGVAKLRTEVNRLLIKHNWDISEYKGYVIVKGVKN
ncbi:15767_t:CDS:2 [Racocetra persica]|uniref:15767_t:CDS:1 n=1 Tax=Racocetra persica TaxID=160502 RepID=A0ACA9LG46_9GLOM|nr:15767_t:CDS:2 [Racocetra persica]